MIALHNIAKSYPLPRGKKVVLDDVNITFRPGENMGILGLNGAGKSTLMRIIGGAELPDSGKVGPAKAGCRGPSALREVSTEPHGSGEFALHFPHLWFRYPESN